MTYDQGSFTYKGIKYDAFDMPVGEVWQIAEDLGWSNPLDDEDMDEIGGHRVDESIWDAVEWIRDNS